MFLQFTLTVINIPFQENMTHCVYMHVCVCVCVYILHVSMSLHSPEETGYLGSHLRDGCELSDMWVLGTKLRCSGRAVPAQLLSHLSSPKKHLFKWLLSIWSQNTWFSSSWEILVTFLGSLGSPFNSSARFCLFTRGEWSQWAWREECMPGHRYSTWIFVK